MLGQSKIILAACIDENIAYLLQNSILTLCTSN